MLFSVQSDREWAVFATKVLGQAALAADIRFATNVARVAHRAELDAMIAPVLGALNREAAMHLLNNAGIACGRLSTLDEMETHPQARHIQVDSPSGPVEMMAPGVRFSDDAATGFGAVPAKGAHSAALRAEFGTKP